MAVRIYDVTRDETREASQWDIDRLELVSNAYGELRRQVEQAHQNLLAKLADLRQRQSMIAMSDVATDPTEDDS
jgi:hypothetical protein